MTFISQKTKKQFVEAHHLIPMEYQDKFDVSIDVPENILSLCPNCHRAFHNSDFELRQKLVIKFYERRKEKLISRSINIDENGLIDFYINNEN